MAFETYANTPTPSSPSTAWTTLASGITALDVTLTVVSASAFPATGQYRILIGDELMLVTSGAGTTTWTVSRGVESTTAAIHALGDGIFHILTAAGLALLPVSICESTISYGASADVVFGRSGTGTLKLTSASASASLGVANGSAAEYGAIGWSGNNFLVGTQGGVGAGTARDTILGSAASAPNGLYFATEATSRWNVSTTGHLRPVATATYDLGTTSELVRSAYLGKIGNLTSNGLVTTSAGDGTLGITALGTGVATFLSTPSSANLRGAITDETGTGVAVFNDTPTILTPTIASLVNATHTHLNAAGGGTLTAAAISDLATAAIAFTNKTGAISQWTNDSGYLTSVTAHNILSATHGDTLTASVVRGDVIIGNSTPKWARLAVGAANSVLSSDGTDVSWVASSGTGNNVRVSNATLIAPTLGVALATSLNGNTFTTGTYTLTGAASKVLTFNHSLTLAGTDSTTMTFPATSASIARTDAAQTFTGSQTIAALVGPVTITEVVGSSGLTITGATQTSSFPALNITQTWNNSGTTFTGIKANFTDTASAAASLILDLQVASGTVFKVNKSGVATLTGPSSTPAVIGGNSQFRAGSIVLGFSMASGTGVALCSDAAGANTAAGANVSGFAASSSSQYGWTSGTLANTVDTFLVRGGAAATVQLGSDVNGAAVSQVLQAANGITGTDKTGGNFTIASGKGTGAGAVSSIFLQTPAILGSSATAQSLVTRVTITESLVTIAPALTVTGAATLSSTLAANGTITMGSGINIATNTGTGTIIGTTTSQKVGFFGTTAVIQQTRGATLTNSVTSGGVDDTIANYTDLTLYANDSAAIRNNFYQLARIVRMHDVALRALGLES